MDQHAASNPFSTRAVRPGVIPFCFPPGCGAELLVQRLAEQGWWGEITGPHGSGKTTLLQALVAPLSRAGRQVERFELHAGQSPFWLRRPAAAAGGEGDRRSPRAWHSATLVVVDGYEQLLRPRRWWLKRLCRRRRCGLLVTAHQATGLPTLFQTRVTRELAHRVARGLLPKDQLTIDAQQIDACFERHPANLREILFALYDLYEESARPADAGTQPQRLE